MRQIDSMTPQEIDTLHLKGMLSSTKAASEATDADERALIPGFKRIRPVDREAQRDAWDEAAEHNRDLEHESRETDEREATGFWDCNEGKSATD